MKNNKVKPNQEQDNNKTTISRDEIVKSISDAMHVLALMMEIQHG